MLTAASEPCTSCSCSAQSTPNGHNAEVASSECRNSFPDTISIPETSTSLVVKAEEPRKRIQRRVIQQIPEEQLNDPLINEAINVGMYVGWFTFSNEQSF